MLNGKKSVKKNWNHRAEINSWERKRQDPTYKFPYDILYTTEKINGYLIDSLPIKADKNGIYHAALV